MIAPFMIQSIWTLLALVFAVWLAARLLGQPLRVGKRHVAGMGPDPSAVIEILVHKWTAPEGDSARPNWDPALAELAHHIATAAATGEAPPGEDGLDALRGRLQPGWVGVLDHATTRVRVPRQELAETVAEHFAAELAPAAHWRQIGVDLVAAGDDWTLALVGGRCVALVETEFERDEEDAVRVLRGRFLPGAGATPLHAIPLDSDGEPGLALSARQLGPEGGDRDLEIRVPTDRAVVELRWEVGGRPAGRTPLGA